MNRSVIFLLLIASVLPAHAELVLRQATASQAVMIGPFVDSTDGATAETALTIDAADVRLSKNGANIVGKNSGGCTHDELGYYTCTFDATDTSTVGRLQVMVSESGALPVYHEFMVAEEAVYDACCASGAAPQTYPTNFASMAITAGGALTVGTNNDKTGYALSAGGVDSILDEALSGHLTAGTLGAAISDILTDTGTTLDGKLNTVDSVADAIKVKTDQLTFGVTNTLNVNVEYQNAAQLCGDGTSGDKWRACP